MKRSQKPAEGISTVKDYDDFKWYAIRCECGDDDHYHDLTVQSDDGLLSVEITTTVTTNWWSNSRWKQIWQILTCGYSKQYSSLILTEQQAVNYADALKTAVKDLERK